MSFFKFIKKIWTKNKETKDFDKYGFLGEEIGKLGDQVYLKNKELFILYESLNKFSQKQKLYLNVTNNDYRNLAIFAFFLKSLETFQAIYFLCKNCFFRDAFNLTRVLFEIMVKISYCCKGEQQCKSYLLEHYGEKLKDINRIINQPNNIRKEFLKKVPLAEFDRIKKETEKQIQDFEKQGIKAASLIEMAGKTGNIDLYLSYYSEGCTESHSRPRSLEKYLYKNNVGDVSSISEYPDCKYAELCLITAIEFMLKVLYALSDNFNIPIKKEIEFYNNQKNELGKVVYTK